VSWRSPWRRRAVVLAVETLRRCLATCRMSESPLLRRLVEDNNRRVRRHLASHPPRTILLILPRCVQRGCCRFDRGDSLQSCRECRECQLGELARLADRLGLEALVAYRSHIAYAMARERRPDLILATACEDRLLKALRSVPEVPALLSPLTGMARQCVDAQFNLDWFTRELHRLPVAPVPGEAARVSGAQAGL